MSRPPKQFLDDLYEIGVVNVTKVAKRPNIDKNLYEVEIVVMNKKRKQIKIHFVNYSDQFDEWRDVMTVKGILYFP